MKLKEYLNSQHRESEKLYKELQALEARFPEVTKQYEQLDSQCVELASRLSAAEKAGSPQGVALSAELRQLRWQRDGIKQKYSREIGELQHQLEALTQPTIQRFSERCLSRVKSLTEKYQFRRVEETQNIYTDTRTIKVQHNSGALAAARDHIFECMKVVRSMNLCPLAAIEKKISEFEREFDNFDFSEMQDENVSPSKAREMEPQSETAKIETGIITAGGDVLTLGESERDRQQKKLQKLKEDLKL